MAASTETTTKTKVVYWLLGIFTVGMVTWAVWPSSRTTDKVELPLPADAQVVAANLARASAAHGICYGWRLEDFGRDASVGSNLGAGTAVEDDPQQCKQFIEIQGDVRYFSDNSESDDYAVWSFYSNIPKKAMLSSAMLDRLGASTKDLTENPAAVILVAAEALPLLAQEAGLVTGTVPEPSAPSSLAPVPSAGSDFWRDRSTLLIVTIGFLLGAAGVLVLGIVAARRSAGGTKPGSSASGTSGTSGSSGGGSAGPSGGGFGGGTVRVQRIQLPGEEPPRQGG